MDLTSYSFILLFLPSTALIYWLVLPTNRLKLWGLTAFSYLFYALGGWEFIPLLFATSAFTFWAGQQKRYTWGLISNLLVLGIFKYWNFGAENFNALLLELGLTANLGLLRFALPLGLSFYTFKHLSYLLDLRQGRYAASDDFLLFNAYSVLWFQISAGPLNSFEQTRQQLTALPSELSTEALHKGLSYLTFGLFKKVILANALGQTVQGALAFPNPDLGVVGGWSLLLLYGIYLYIDFSGYTDMVLGMATWFGLTLPANFNNPYQATTPQDFWRRWHISLSEWFQGYLFMPFSRSALRRWGSRYKLGIQFSANFLTMTLIGLWHGATWGFILWGIYHAALLNTQLLLTRRQWHPRLSRLARPLTLLAIFIGWGFFLSPSLDFWQHLAQSLMGMNEWITKDDYYLLWDSRFSNFALLISLFLIQANLTETPLLLQKVPEFRYTSQLSRQSVQVWIVVLALFYLGFALLRQTLVDVPAQPFMYTLF